MIFLSVKLIQGDVPVGSNALVFSSDSGCSGLLGAGDEKGSGCLPEFQPRKSNRNLPNDQSTIFQYYILRS